MDYLELEEKLEIKKNIEKKIYLKEKDEKKINLLKGSLDINQKRKVEKLLQENKYTYTTNGEEKEARSFCIGKVIVILCKDRNSIIKFISLENFDFGISEYIHITEGNNQEYIKENKKIREKLDTLINEFENLGKWDKVKKGKILEEIDDILTENKNLGKKTEMWEKLGISKSDKSMLCKRYNLFKEFQENANYFGDKDCMKVIEEMTDLNLKKVTKEGISMEEKESIILSLI